MPQRSQHQNGGQWVRPATRLAIYLRDGFICLWCGEDLRDQPGQLTLDHYRPRATGGSNSSENLLTSCRDCNSDRRDRPARAFLASRYSGTVYMVPQKLMTLRRQLRRRIVKHRQVAKEILDQLGVQRGGSRNLTAAVKQANAHRGRPGSVPTSPRRSFLGALSSRSFSRPTATQGAEHHGCEES